MQRFAEHFFNSQGYTAGQLTKLATILAGGKAAKQEIVVKIAGDFFICMLQQLQDDRGAHAHDPVEEGVVRRRAAQP